MSLLIAIFLIILFCVFGKFFVGFLGLLINRKYMYECCINQIIRYSPTTKEKIKPYISDLVNQIIKYSNENYSYKINKFNEEIILLKAVAMRCVMYVAPKELINIPQNLYCDKFEAISIATEFLEENSII